MNEKISKVLSLARIPIVQEDNHDIVIRCFNPNHIDDNPSLRIDKETGLYNCFPCGECGNLTKLLYRLQVELSPEELEEIRLDEILRKLKELEYVKETTYHIQEIRGSSFISDFRDFKPDFLNSFDIVRNRSIGRIVFPISLHYVLRGYTMRAIHGQQPKYLHSEDIEFSELLYPYDYVLENKPETIYLVEGPIDALRLISLGRHALCIFGTAWSDTKLSLLLTLAPKNVILFFDNDEAGYTIRTKVAFAIKNFFNTYIITNMHKLGITDPGEINLEQLEQLKYRRWV